MAEKKDKPATEEKKSNTRLDAVLSQIRKEFGDMSIMRLGSDEHQNIPVISTGALSLDMALGVGGLPRGRIVECYGQESSGKTTLALHVVANAQKAGGVAAFIDAEHALDPGYAKQIGVDLDNLIVSQPNSGEEALTICEQLAKSGALDVIVVDSVAALVPQA
jgi:recombination protein RecA